MEVAYCRSSMAAHLSGEPANPGPRDPEHILRRVHPRTSGAPGDSGSVRTGRIHLTHYLTEYPQNHIIVEELAGHPQQFHVYLVQ